MKKNLFIIFIIFLIFNNIFLNIIKLPSFFNYWDEFITFIIILKGMIHVIYKKKTISKKGIRIFISLIIIIVIGLLGNLCFRYMNSISAIIRDIVGFIKFPIALLLLKELKLDSAFDNILSNKFNILIKGLIVVIFSLGILSLFWDLGLSLHEIRYGIKPYKFLFSHPTFLVLSEILLLSIIESIRFNNNKDIYIYEAMILITIAFTMRTKGIAIAGIFIFIKYIWKKIIEFKNLKNIKNLGKKNIILICSGIVITFLTMYLVYDKITLYISYSTSPREEMYKGALLLIKKCFPLGSGFATFASHISGKFNSSVYDFIKITYYWTENGLETNVLGDAGFAYYLGQFGIFGFIIFIFILYKLYQLTIKNVDNKLPIILIWIYIILTLTSESIIINNGIELAFILTFLSTINKKRKQNQRMQEKIDIRIEEIK